MNKNKPTRDAIIVISSETKSASAISAILRDLEFAVSKRWHIALDSSSDNDENIYHEDLITLLNNDLSKAIGISPLHHPPLPSDWFSSPEANMFTVRAQSDLLAEYGHAERFVIADRNIHFLLPFWHHALTNAQCRARHIFIYQRLNDIAGFAHEDEYEYKDDAYLRLLRLGKLLQAEASSRRRPRTFIPYDRLLIDWKATIARVGRELDMEWSSGADQVLLSVENSVDVHPSLVDDEYHGNENSDEFHNLAKKIFDIFDMWAEKGENESDHLILDTLKIEIDHHLASYTDAGHQHVTVENDRSYSNESSREYENDQAHSDEITYSSIDIYNKLSLSQENHKEEISVLKSNKQNTEDSVENVEKNTEILNKRIDQLINDQSALESLVETKEVLRVSAEHAHDQLKSALVQRRHEIEELYSQQTQRDASINALNAAIDELKFEHGRLSRRHDDACNNIIQMENRLAAQMQREGQTHRVQAEVELTVNKQAEHINFLESKLSDLILSQERKQVWTDEQIRNLKEQREKLENLLKYRDDILERERKALDEERSTAQAREQAFGLEWEKATRRMLELEALVTERDHMLAQERNALNEQRSSAQAREQAFGLEWEKTARRILELEASVTEREHMLAQERNALNEQRSSAQAREQAFGLEWEKTARRMLELEASVTERDHMLAQERNALNEQRSSAQAREIDFELEREKAAHRMRELEALVTERDHKLAQERSALNEQRSSAQAREIDFELEREKAAHRMRELEASVTERDHMLAQERDALKEQRSSARTKALAMELEREKAVRRIGELDAYTSEIVTSRKKIEDAMKEKDKENEILREQIYHLDKSFNKIKSSLSWRHTAPIRKFVRFIKLNK